MIDFSPTPEQEQLRRITTQLMERYVYPAEEHLTDTSDPDAASFFPGIPDSVLRPIQAKAKELGLWAPHMPEDAGGMGIGVVGLGLMNEIIGRSPLGPVCFGCQAPDAGNEEILHMYGTEEQKRAWLRPNVAGEVRSCFSMTEPEVSGADPTNLQTTAVLEGNEWVINGHKWFTSGAMGASFAIVMAKTEPRAPTPRDRFSMIVVPLPRDGVSLKPIKTMGHTLQGGGHCEVRYDNCRVPRQNLLGARGAGFKIAQSRLGPGRIQHCMRWLGVARRAMDLMCRHVVGREAFGTPLAEKQTVQNWIADSEAEMEAARLLTLQAAWKMDQKLDWRVDVSLIKFFGAKVLHDVVDRAVQAHGAMGISAETPLEMFYRSARAARIYDGPDEVHRMVVARRILRQYR
ncbi:MAG TPA: acyl-CoA dehydrogenase family protein [Candidatus Methylomirabilis sp.]|nr:acyl-CoA dehydrogenase family protein [Candidatus Methylomirabilis sp.]